MKLDEGLGIADWTALGTYVQLTVAAGEPVAPAAAEAAATLRLVDRCASRFRADSELTRVNQAAGRWVRVHPLLVEATQVAVEAARLTDGLVNPLLGETMVALGYDRTFANLPVDVRPVGQVAVDRDAWQRIDLDPAGAIRIPVGTALDLGATGKAFAADLIAVRLAGLAGIVSVGGDVAVIGEGAEWPVSIGTHPEDVDEVVWLSAGGLTTSSTRLRRWSSAGVALHHLIDPRTGRPAAEVWTTVTAAGDSAIAANVASTAAIVLGAKAPAWLADHEVKARLVDDEGTIVRINWPEPPTKEKSR